MTAASKLNGGSFSDGFKAVGGLSALSEASLWMRNMMVDQSTIHADLHIKESAGLGDDMGIGGVRAEEKGFGFKWGMTGGTQQNGGNWVGFTWDGLPLKGFGIAYKPYGVVDRIVEAFAGPHDYMGSWGYTSDGLQRDFGIIGSTAHGIGSVVTIPLAAPFAVAGALQVYTPTLHYSETIRRGSSDKVSS